MEMRRLSWGGIEKVAFPECSLCSAREFDIVIGAYEKEIININVKV